MRVQDVRVHVDPSFRALSGRLKFTVQRHEFEKDILSYSLCTPRASAPRPPACAMSPPPTYLRFQG